MSVFAAMAAAFFGFGLFWLGLGACVLVLAPALARPVQNPSAMVLIFWKRPKRLDGAALGGAARRAWHAPTEVLPPNADRVHAIVLETMGRWVSVWQATSEEIERTNRSMKQWFDEIIDQNPGDPFCEVTWLSVLRRSRFLRKWDERGALYRLTAELLDEDASEIWTPGADERVPVGRRTCEWLRGDDPMRAFRLPIIRGADEEPRMQAATAQARATWAEFCSRWDNRTPNQRYLVRLERVFRGGVVCGWARVVEIDSTTVRAVFLAEDSDRHMAVECEAKNILDWMWLDSSTDERGGGWTDDVVDELRREARARHIEGVDA